MISALEDHAGEEYDDYVTVPDEPTTEIIQEWANRIRGRIRKLWNEDKDDDKGVEVYLDGPTPYHAIMCNLEIVMPVEEKIVVNLCYQDEIPEVKITAEMREVLREDYVHPE
jgi:hypothetical protein